MRKWQIINLWLPARFSAVAIVAVLKRRKRLSLIKSANTRLICGAIITRLKKVIGLWCKYKAPGFRFMTAIRKSLLKTSFSPKKVIIKEQVSAFIIRQNILP